VQRSSPKLPAELEELWGREARAAPGPAYPVATYPELVRVVAQLAHMNPGQVLYFRGQGEDHRNRGGSSTFYPSIYRGDPVKAEELRARFDLLARAESALKELAEKYRPDGYQDLARRQYVRWSVLQHYEVCDTPLLDLTHSLSVACSFAQLDSPGAGAAVYVYAFLLPYGTNRISVNSEEDLVNVRLLSIAPPAALRPFFQEGYLTGTTDVTWEFSGKSELDFKRRLAAKFEIVPDQQFWTDGFGSVPEHLLYPPNDVFAEMLSGVGLHTSRELEALGVGEFLVAWRDVEVALLLAVRKKGMRGGTAMAALRLLDKEGLLSAPLTARLDTLRQFRNYLVHDAREVTSGELHRQLAEAKKLIKPLTRLAQG